MALKLGELSTILKANIEPFQRDLRQARQAFEQHRDQLKQSAMVAGLAIGAALGAGLLGAVEKDKAATRLAAQLGGNAEYAREMGAIAGRVYARGFGENATQVGDTLRSVLSSGLLAEDAAAADIEAITVKAQALADVFGQDVTQTARAAGQMVRTGLAANAAEAMDLLTRGFQATGDHAGDLLDTVSEYSTQFRNMGLDGKTALGLIEQGLKAGARDSDVVADTIKEFSIEAVAGGERVRQGFASLGLDADKMVAAFAKGGPTAAGALDTVLDRLRAIKDPAERNAVALELFGTKAEDMGAALFALDVDAAAGRIGKVTGAADELGKTLEESSAQKLEVFKRKAMSALSDTMAQAVPYLEKVVGFLSRNSEIVGPLAVGLGALALVIGTVAAALKVWAVVQAVLNLALWTSPITWIVLGILALVAVVVLIATKTTWFQDLWKWVWGGIKDAASAVGDWFVNTLWKKWIVGAWDGIVGAAKGAWNWLKALPGRLKSAFFKVADFITSPFRRAFNAVAGLWNRTVGRLRFTVPGWVPGIGGKTISMPTLPMLARGGHILRAGAALVGEAGPEILELPAGATVRPLSGGGSGGGGELSGTLRVILQWPDGRVIKDQLIDAATLRGQTPGRYLGIT